VTVGSTSCSRISGKTLRAAGGELRGFIDLTEIHVMHD
jgi:hypothetical protein